MQRGYRAYWLFAALWERRWLSTPGPGNCLLWRGGRGVLWRGTVSLMLSQLCLLPPTFVKSLGGRMGFSRWRCWCYTGVIPKVRRANTESSGWMMKWHWIQATYWGLYFFAKFLLLYLKRYNGIALQGLPWRKLGESFKAWSVIYIYLKDNLILLWLVGSIKSDAFCSRQHSCLAIVFFPSQVI